MPCQVAVRNVADQREGKRVSLKRVSLPDELLKAQCTFGNCMELSAF